MTLSPARVPAPGVRRITATLYGYSFLCDLVLLYPVYALLFADTGLTVGQISSLFALWAVTGLLAEIPSGAWADAVSRRLLLWLGPLLGAAGFALWVTVPSYPAFAAGFVLWGVGESLCSGALEALVHEELDRLGAADRYARIMGRAHAAGLAGVVAATAAAGPLLGLGGYPAVGAVSVLACLLTAAVATRFPEHRDPRPAGGGNGWTASLRDGLAEARHRRPVRRALLVVPAVTAVWGTLDEYTPLLARDTGVADTTVPLMLLVIWVGATGGGLLAGAGERLGTKGLAGLLTAAALCLIAGALAGTPAAIVLVALSFGGFQLASVLADARLQARVTGPARATITSLAGMGTGLATAGAYGAYGLVAAVTGHAGAFAALAVPYLLTSLLMVAARPAAARAGEEARATRG